MKRLIAALLCALMLLPGALAQENTQAAQAAQTPLPVRRPQPAPWAGTGHIATEGFPALTAEGFLPEGEEEYVFEDAEQGVWRYASQTLRVVIRRVEEKVEGRRQRSLIAEVFVKEGGEGFRLAAHAPGHLMDNQNRYKEKQNLIAARDGMVLGINTDYFIYRVTRRQRTGTGYYVGVVVRGHELLAEAQPRPGASLYPPLDMLALFEDGDMQAYLAGELTGQQLVEMGARDVLSFGPVLVRGGELGSFDKVRGATPQPRAGIGMFAPGHYLCIVAEGRIKESKGLSCEEFARMFLERGCGTAFNLDGGETSCMVFMGRQLNQLKLSGVYDNARPQHEVMGIGRSQLPLERVANGK